MAGTTITVERPVPVTRPAAGADEAERFPLLVARARGGDRAALEDLLQASYSFAFPVCRRIVGNDPDACDATQEALISVVRGLPRFDGHSRYTTWLYRIAVNASVDELRRRSRRPVPFPAGETLVATGAEPGRPAAGATAAGRPSGALSGEMPDAADAVADAVDVDAALMRLPIDFRAAVVLRDLCGLDYEEIAGVLAVPIGTVRSRIARGRSQLAGLLGPAAGEDRAHG